MILELNQSVLREFGQLKALLDQGKDKQLSFPSALQPFSFPSALEPSASEPYCHQSLSILPNLVLRKQGQVVEVFEKKEINWVNRGCRQGGF
ncbi:MAG: hypothetical protein F6K47_26540 [Symploca sp. SIO2E6]|nr:hypothetical protein [Symploca sp. SIO2E6]